MTKQKVSLAEYHYLLGKQNLQQKDSRVVVLCKCRQKKKKKI